MDFIKRIKKVTLFTSWLFLIGHAFCFGQQGNIWAFGFNSGLNFNGATAVPYNTSIVANEASASVCDASGQLLFYTNGTKVWDRNNILMPNGSGLQTLSTDNASSTQGALIVPMPDSAHKYYIFSMTEYGATNGSLFYSVVNMNLNSGFGDVQAGLKAIFVDSNFTEQMAAVRGQNCELWLLTVSRQDTLKSFRIDYSGLNTVPVKSPVLFSRGIYEGVIGSIDVSPDRQKMALARGRVSLYDFNPLTGTCSNAMYLDTGYYHYSACFSPDNSKLYASNENGGLNQYNLSAATPAQILASKYQVSSLRFFALRRGPDQKVYVVNSTQANDNTLNTIHLPNLAGAACQYGNGPALLLGLRIGLPTYVIPGGVVRGEESSTTTISGSCGVINLNLTADTSGSNYVWNDGSNAPTLFVTAPGTYWVKYDKPCNRHTDTFQVVYDFLPGFFPQLKIKPACKNIDNGGAWVERNNTDTTTYNMIWRNAQQTIVSVTDTLQAVVTGNYTLQIQAANGCDTIIPFSIAEEDLKTGFTMDTLICEGDEVLFHNISDNGFDRFLWFFGDGNTDTQPDPAHVYGNAGTYQVTLHALGTVCNDTLTKIITVDAPLTGLDLKISPRQLCVGEAVHFSLIGADGLTGKGFLWSFGDGSSFTRQGSGALQHAYDAEGLMSVHLTALFRACPDMDLEDSVVVAPFPVVFLGPDTGLCLGSAPIYLSDATPVVPGNRYLWNTGDTSRLLKVVHHGMYSLQVTSANGCATTESVLVNKDCYIDVPNAFTPNGDGYNDHFFPRQLLSSKVTRFSLKVLNRWGQTVFETNSPNGRGWDGSFNGAQQSGGVYLYLIETEINGNHVEKYQGNVTLLR